LADLALELANPSFTRVALDQLAQRFIRDLQLLGGQAVLLELPGNEVALRDFEFLLARIAREVHRLEPIEQRRGNRLEEIRCRDEQHLRKVERHTEVMIRE